MTPEEFVNGLSGMEWADDDPDYCPAHGWHWPCMDDDEPSCTHI